MTPLFSSMTLNNLELRVFLGWQQTERLQEQTVIVDLNLRFIEPPRACASDKLEDTYCYDSLVKKLKDSFAQRKFHLLEHLAQAIYQLIKQSVSAETKVNLRIKKMPISYVPDLKGGVTFQYGDDNSVW